MDKWKRITTTIRNIDADFLRTQDLKVAHAIRVFCEERRTGKAQELEEQLKQKTIQLEAAATRTNDIFKILGERLNKEDFEALIEKI